ncbi:hypothetical protein FKM82_026160 [Ascaphus truei]
MQPVFIYLQGVVITGADLGAQTPKRGSGRRKGSKNRIPSLKVSGRGELQYLQNITWRQLGISYLFSTFCDITFWLSHLYDITLCLNHPPV